PVEWSLNGDNGAAAVSVAPCHAMRIDPLDDVERLQLGDWKAGSRWGEVDEALDMVVVPVVGAGFPMLLAPAEILVEHLGDGQPGGLRFRLLNLRSRAVGGHDLVVFLPGGGLCFGISRGIGELDLLLADLDVPAAASAEERFRMVWHCRTLQRFAGPEGSFALR